MSDANAHLGAALEGVARLIIAGIEPDENTVRALLLSAGLDPSTDLVREVLRWSYLLLTLKWQPSAELRAAAFETLTRRGLPPALVDTVLDRLTAASPISATGTFHQAAHDATRPSDSVRDALGQRSVGSRAMHRDIGVRFVRQAAGRAAIACRSGLALVLLVGLILRVWLATTQSAWLDEALSLREWAVRPLGVLFRTIQYDVHPPLYYAALHIWLGITGFGVFQARLLSVAFGVATIVVIYLLADLLFDRVTALCAALLLAISPIAIWYSDEIRMYAATGLFALLTVYLLLRAMKERQWRWWVGYSVCAALAIGFDSSGAYLPLAANLFYIVLLARRAAPLRPWLASNALALLLALPTLLLLRYQLADHGTASLGWIPAPTMSIVWSSVLDDFSLNGDRSWAGAMLAALLVLSGLGIARDRRVRPLRRAYLLLALMIFTPFAAPLAASLSHSLFLTRTSQTSVYGLLILLARGIVLVPRIRIPAGALAFIAIASLNATSLYAAATTKLKEDWRDLAQYANHNVSPDSLVIVDPYWLYTAFNLYWQPYHRQVAQHADPPITSESLAAQVFRGFGSVWLISYYIYGVDHPPVDAGTTFLGKHYRLTSTTRFYGLSLYHFMALSSAEGGPSGTLVDSVRVLPARVRNGSTALMQIQTLPGAVCTLQVIYDGAGGEPGWIGAAQPADGNGGVAWSVRIVTKANAGTVVAPCTLAGRTVRGKARVFVVH